MVIPIPLSESSNENLPKAAAEDALTASSVAWLRQKRKLILNEGERVQVAHGIKKVGLALDQMKAPAAWYTYYILAVVAFVGLVLLGVLCFEGAAELQMSLSS